MLANSFYVAVEQCCDLIAVRTRVGPHKESRVKSRDSLYYLILII